MGAHFERQRNTKKESKKSKRKKAFSKNINHNSFSALRHDLARSEEFRDLSSAAIKVFVILLGLYNGHNNGNLSAPLTQSQKIFGMAEGTLSRALKELEEKGFIEKTRQGHKNQCNLFGVTCCRMDMMGTQEIISPTLYPSDDWKRS